MLLLVAMYFHSNQLSAIIELVCSTLGMKIAIKPSSLSKMKTIFTQEIFIEQVVTAHAVRVAVTNNLCANITGFSRAFTKHKVSIKVTVDIPSSGGCSPLSPTHRRGTTMCAIASYALLWSAPSCF
uniref:Uncharacterized protein n=1 Tax=Hucho hucho TaxID=62062 RepID=A0A4W5NIZ1_9TELE